MNANKVLTRDYENKSNWKLDENKANTKPIKPNTKPIKPKTKPIKPKTNPIQTQYKPNQSQFQTGRLLIDPMLPLYKPGNHQYYIRHIRRCSSMVERSFRKAEVVGPNPSIGFVNLGYEKVWFDCKK